MKSIKVDKNNLEIGKYYCGYGYWGQVIVKAEYKTLYDNNPFINKERNFYRGECLTGNEVEFREPTPEEIFPLEECIRLNKYIPIEEIDFNNKEILYEVY